MVRGAGTDHVWRHDVGNGVALSHFFETVFRPLKLTSAQWDYCSQYRTAIRHLAAAIGGEPALVDLTRANVERVERELCRVRLRTLWRYAATLGLLDPPPRLLRLREVKTEAPPAAGTVWHFFETVYRSFKLLGCKAQTVKAHRYAMQRLRDHYGRDVLLDEQSDALAADHFAWLLDEGIEPTTINTNHRAPWFAVWRLAVERGRLAQGPRFRKLTERWDEPDAWTEDEMRRLVAATEALAGRAAGFTAAKYFRALLLVGYWSALRRGALMRLPRKALNLETGWLYVPAELMKNRRGKRLRIGADAVAAVRDIWQPPRELLFPWPHNTHRLYETFDELLHHAGVEPSTRRSQTKFHKIRRTVATHVTVRAGLSAACDLLGHSSSDVTKRYVDPSQLPGHDTTTILSLLSMR